MGRSVPRDIASIPHWARVAFAARCSRNVLPLFAEFWPGALPRRLDLVRAAVALTEQSAASGKVSDGLGQAEMDSTEAAGAALMPTYGIPLESSDEAAPADDHACHIASYVAKSAEWAAKTAQAGKSGSAHAALETYTWARDAAHMAEAADILGRRVAKQARWSDDAPVPPVLFDVMGEGRGGGAG
jgi:hypothetical protein